MRIRLGTIVSTLRPRIHRIIVALPSWYSSCSKLFGEYPLAGCIPYVPIGEDQEDVLGLYLLGGP